MDDLHAQLTAIATKHLGIASLEARNADSLDFHSVACWSVKQALMEAYRLGQESTG
ncbi:DUF6900 domain-containing protein [Tautonia plasticadhaerens]|uniref:DUF6900 domain-containing protein n=1 Tax=Tautonia plasticadhaerens TaxID=2527974 RepID=UPI0036F26BD2